MTGSALNIAAGQVPSLLGYSSKLKYASHPSLLFPLPDLLLHSTRAATYNVIINTLKNLPNTKRDAAFGLSGLFFLYFVRWGFARVERRARNPIIKKMAFFATTLRTAFVIIILTAAAYAYCHNMKTPNISILKTVPSGFKHMGQPSLPTGLLSAIAPDLPVSTIILLLEHIVRLLRPPFSHLPSANILLSCPSRRLSLSPSAASTTTRFVFLLFLLLFFLESRTEPSFLHRLTRTRSLSPSVPLI